jgi:hypothetical protein
MKTFLLLFALGLSISVSEAGFFGIADVDFVPYEGSQAGWKTSPGAMVDRRYRLPVYHGWPPKPYVVIGKISVSGAGGFTQTESAVRDAVATAQKHGSQAVIMLDQGKTSEGGWISGSPQYGFNVTRHTRGYAQVLAIKWR